eukprot:NODE_321_length_9805_cov_0.700185.p5 type:complete len:296 gc:universal NODE_321_length_9805_cov_0.700185:2836-3723(+)
MFVMLIFTYTFSVYSDLASPQLFDFKFLKTDALPENTIPYKTGRRQFYCSIPPSPASSKVLTPREDLDYSAFLQVSKCLYLNSGWWTYELCPSTSEDSIRQLHLDNNVETDGYTLGKSNQKYELQERNGQYVIIKNFNRGTLCDVNQKPREVKVEYSCFLDNEKITLTNLMEESTCLYRATVHVPQLCGVEGFQKKTNTNDITCYYLEDKKPKVADKAKAHDIKEEDDGEMEGTENVAEDGQIDLGQLSSLVSKLMDQADFQMVMVDNENLNLKQELQKLLNKKKKKEKKKKEEL